MKKLLKIEICVFVNSARYALISWKLFDKLNFADFTATVYAQCINSNRNSKICPKTHEKKKNANANASAEPKRTPNLHLWIVLFSPLKLPFVFFFFFFLLDNLGDWDLYIIVRLF